MYLERYIMEKQTKETTGYFYSEDLKRMMKENAFFQTNNRRVRDERARKLALKLQRWRLEDNLGDHSLQCAYASNESLREDLKRTVEGLGGLRDLNTKCRKTVMESEPKEILTLLCQTYILKNNTLFERYI